MTAHTFIHQLVEIIKEKGKIDVSVQFENQVFTLTIQTAGLDLRQVDRCFCFLRAVFIEELGMLTYVEYTNKVFQLAASIHPIEEPERQERILQKVRDKLAAALHKELALPVHETKPTPAPVSTLSEEKLANLVVNTPFGQLPDPVVRQQLMRFLNAKEQASFYETGHHAYKLSRANFIFYFTVQDASRFVTSDLQMNFSDVAQDLTKTNRSTCLQAFLTPEEAIKSLHFSTQSTDFAIVAVALPKEALVNAFSTTERKLELTPRPDWDSSFVWLRDVIEIQPKMILAVTRKHNAEIVDVYNNTFAEPQPLRTLVDVHTRGPFDGPFYSASPARVQATQERFVYIDLKLDDEFKPPFDFAHLAQHLTSLFARGQPPRFKQNFTALYKDIKTYKDYEYAERLNMRRDPYVVIGIQLPEAAFHYSRVYGDLRLSACNLWTRERFTLEEDNISFYYLIRPDELVVNPNAKLLHESKESPAERKSIPAEPAFGETLKQLIPSLDYIAQKPNEPTVKAKFEAAFQALLQHAEQSDEARQESAEVAATMNQALQGQISPNCFLAYVQSLRPSSLWKTCGVLLLTAAIALAVAAATAVPLLGIGAALCGAAGVGLFTKGCLVAAAERNENELRP